MAEKDISNDSSKKITETGDISHSRLAAEIDRIWSTFEDVGSGEYIVAKDNRVRLHYCAKGDHRQRTTKWRTAYIGWPRPGPTRQESA